MAESGLNISGRIAHYFIDSKLTITFIVACVLLGSVALILTPREENPQIVIPGAEVLVTLPGATAGEVEQLVLIPLEGVISDMTGVKHTYGTAVNSLAIVMVQFDACEDKEDSLTKLYDKVMGNRRYLPPGAGEPEIKNCDVDDVPIVAITLASEVYDDYALKRLADRMVERLRSLKDVSVTEVVGGRDREVRIEVDPERLQAFGVTLDQIHDMVKATNRAGQVGDTVKNSKYQTIFLDGFLSSAADLRRLIVANHSGYPIYLEDVVDVIDGPPNERDYVTRFAYGPADPRFDKTRDPEIPAVTFALAKKQGANAVFVSRDILKRVERMRKSFIPAGVDLVVTRDDGRKADATVNSLVKHLAIAVVCVFVVMLFFLGFKEALIVGLSVPLILFLTLGADYLFGPTINRVSLFALIMSIGLLVDAAIVVIENIHRHYRHLSSQDKRLATVLATDEIGNPTNLATLAIILVHLSLVLLTGVWYPYWHPILFNVPVAMIASLVVAYIITPWAANRWLKPEEGQDPGNRVAKSRLHRGYYAVIMPLLDRKWLRAGVLLIIGILTTASVLQLAWPFLRPQGVGGPLPAGAVNMDIMPKEDKNTFNITIDMPETTALEVTDGVAREVGEALRNNPYVANYLTYAGIPGIIDFNGLMRGARNKRGPHIAEIRVNLLDKEKRYISSLEIVRKLRPKIQTIEARYPGLVIQLVEDPPGPPSRAKVLAEIYGPDPIVLREISERVTKEFRTTYDVVEVHDSEVEDVRQHRVVVDKEKAELSCVTTAQVIQALHCLLGEKELGRIHIPGEKNPIPIRLHVPRRHRIDPRLMERIFVTNAHGEPVPLSEVVRVIPAWQDRPIMHKDNEQVTYVGAEMHHSAPIYAVLDLNRRLDGLKLNGGQLTTGNLTLSEAVPDTTGGYQLLWSGDMRLSLDIIRDLCRSLALSLVVMYLLFVAYYHSFIIPVIVMTTILLGLAGVFPGHWIMGQPFCAPSLAGIIALSGVAVRSSLLIIDFAKENLSRGMPLKEAVCEAGAVRLRPILLTTLAVMSGTAVMLSDELFGGLACSLIFGTLASTVLSVMVVPVLFYLFMRHR